MFRIRNKTLKKPSEDILYIDKPYGISSHKAIQTLKKRLNCKKIGHAGTLDPLASGLLIVGKDSGTKKLSDYVGLDKVYEANIFFGVQTDTSDAEGQITKSIPVKSIDSAKLNRELSKLIGIQSLPISKYSAIKYKGKPLYWYARKDITAPTPKKDMEIYEAKLLSIEDDVMFKDIRGVIAHIKLHVSSGTYIRSIVEEIGKRMDIPATMSDLRRVKVGNIDVKDAAQIK